ncbi:MAG: putative hydro-lyase [Hyphomicrobiaceae bacterium]
MAPQDGTSAGTGLGAGADGASGLQSAAATGEAARRLFRGGGYTGFTHGLAPGFVQANLAVLPKDLASDFLRFCQLNPKPCPLIGMSPAPGDPGMPELGADLDIRTDIPMYRVWRKGELVAEVPDISEFWRDDLVAFALGCSFSFEEALVEDGLELRHQVCGVNVPMFRTSIACQPCGPFRGPMVVSMRPFKPADAIRAVQITSRFPAVHGAPVHIGLPEMIGIRNLGRPDYGDAVEVRSDELPVFWACGVTPQAVIAAIGPELAITHAPGAMLVTDIRNSRLAAL